MKNKSSLLIKIVYSPRLLFKKIITKFRDGYWWPVLALLVIAGVWIWIAKEIPLPVENTVEKYGVYGDSFGQLTSFFTALGFAGLIITIFLQQKQLRSQDEAYKHSKFKEEKAEYEEILFRLLEIYRQTLLEVSVGDFVGRSVLREALSRVDAAIVEEGVSGFPPDLQGRIDGGNLNESDYQRIDYFHYRNFKIVGAEIHPQARLVDTFEVLLDHVVSGAPNQLLIDTYKKLVFAQITFLECRYFFLVSLSHPSRSRLRELLAASGFFDNLSRTSTHRIHRDMYKEYWGVSIDKRPGISSIPMPPGRVKSALRAHKAAGGTPKRTYTLLGVRRSKDQLNS